MKRGVCYLIAVCVIAAGVAGVFRLIRNRPESHFPAFDSANSKSNRGASPQFSSKLRATRIARNPESSGNENVLERDLAHARKAGDGAALRRLAKQIEAGAKTANDLKLARKVFEEAAQLSDTEAKLRAGYYAQHGIGGKRDRKSAMQWYESAAADGDMKGYTALARLFIEGGPGLPVDLARAAGYIEIALSAGNAEAMFLKGSMLLGTSNDPTAALEYLAKAAAMKNPDAQLALSRLYAEGKYVPADPALAAQWALAAEQNGSVDAKIDLANYSLKKGDGIVGADMATDSVNRLFEASDQKNIRASLELAALTLAGGNISRDDIAFARNNGQMAYDAGTASGAFVVAATYAGESADEAEEWLKKGAVGKDWRSKYALALMDFGNIGVADAIQSAAKATFSDFTTLSLQKNAGSASLIPPAAISTPMPKFPTELRGLSIAGAVTAEFTVSNTGSPVGIQILSSSHPQLETAAMEAIAKWTFKPAVQNGTAVPLKIRVPIRFRSSGGS